MGLRLASGLRLGWGLVLGLWLGFKPHHCSVDSFPGETGCGLLFTPPPPKATPSVPWPGYIWKGMRGVDQSPRESRATCGGGLDPPSCVKR